LAIVEFMTTRKMAPDQILRRARKLAGLTQRELAARAGTAQSVVARIEAGKTSPTFATLVGLLAAAGFALEAELVPRTPGPSHMLADVDRILALTPEERLQEVANLSRFEAGARRV
jgi:transcriptional regulator with XRE-family HTH domain